MTTTLTPYTPPPFERIAPRERIGSPHTWPVHHAEQAERCLRNLEAVCAAAGTSLARALRVSIYMTDLAAFGEVNEVYARHFAQDPPARVTIGVSQLPRGAYVEIDAIVALG